MHAVQSFGVCLVSAQCTAPAASGTPSHRQQRAAHLSRCTRVLYLVPSVCVSFVCSPVRAFPFLFVPLQPRGAGDPTVGQLGVCPF
jgi:hypothetical protein